MELLQAKIETSLTRYVSMPTVPTDIAACSAAIKGLATELGELGMTTHIDGPIHPWLIATTTPDGMERKHVKVLFGIHFDVVPPENEGQLALRATSDKLFGRGVYDMKFAAACVKEMIASFAAKSTLQDYDFGVLITTDEEKGGYDGTLHFLQQGWRCDIAIIPDSGYDWSVEARAKGITYVYLSALGRAAHSSRPWLGDNPISRLAPAIDSITKHFANDDPQGVVVSVNSLESSNSGVNQTTQIASWAKAGISVRAFTTGEIEESVQYIREVAKTHNVMMQTTLQEPPVHLLRDYPLVQQFMAVARDVRGAEIKLTDSMAASDARHFAKYDIPTVLMYPNGGDHHGPQEWIARHDLYTYYRLCKTFIERVA